MGEVIVKHLWDRFPCYNHINAAIRNGLLQFVVGAEASNNFPHYQHHSLVPLRKQHVAWPGRGLDGNHLLGDVLNPSPPTGFRETSQNRPVPEREDLSIGITTHHDEGAEMCLSILPDHLALRALRHSRTLNLGVTSAGIHAVGDDVSSLAWVLTSPTIGTRFMLHSHGTHPHDVCLKEDSEGSTEVHLSVKANLPLSVNAHKIGAFPSRPTTATSRDSRLSQHSTPRRRTC